MELALTNNDVAIHYTIRGKGYPLVMIHGQFMNTSMFDSFNDAFKDFQLIKIDLRGHGLSDKLTSITMDGYIEDVLTVLDKLFIKNAHFMGFGLGGMVAGSIAAKYPEYVNRLIVMSVGQQSYYEAEQKFHSKYASIIRTLSRSKRNEVLMEYMYHDIKTVKKYYKKMIEPSNGLTDKEEDAVILSTIDFNVEDFKFITAPTLILNGKYDELIPQDEAETIHQYISDSKLITFEKSGHAMLFEEKEHFEKEVLDFLKQE
ncbi:alpha/beta hydrolase [Macrococcus caseolyticus]|uniref:alpha/beta fold hydrolase n=1 Tax=Macrococcoides caseolyticum TaxID=69966 RepID=UPI0024BCAF72|nr:alpha/beta hydrolase [Macrococcus caseolyticus]MDJ1109563.1 alpha/beta hydrolase [Macrococcus caseolyticus]